MVLKNQRCLIRSKWGRFRRSVRGDMMGNLNKGILETLSNVASITPVRTAPSDFMPPANLAFFWNSLEATASKDNDVRV